MCVFSSLIQKYGQPKWNKENRKVVTKHRLIVDFHENGLTDKLSMVEYVNTVFPKTLITAIFLLKYGFGLLRYIETAVYTFLD